MTRPLQEAERFVGRLAQLNFEHVFNPYADTCEAHDLPAAPEIRRQNLTIVLEAALSKGVDSVWVARDLGHGGGRRTGLAMTDDAHLEGHGRLFAVDGLCRATRSGPPKELTAGTVWRALTRLNRPVFLWNIFPLHPHQPGISLSNRCHSRAERGAAAPLLNWLLQELKPKSVLAIGRDAQTALAAPHYAAVPVRHPAFGGQAEFLGAVERHYRL